MPNSTPSWRTPPVLVFVASTSAPTSAQTIEILSRTPGGGSPDGACEGRPVTIARLVTRQNVGGASQVRAVSRD